MSTAKKKTPKNQNFKKQGFLLLCDSFYSIPLWGAIWDLPNWFHDPLGITPAAEAKQDWSVVVRGGALQAHSWGSYHLFRSSSFRGKQQGCAEKQVRNECPGPCWVWPRTSMRWKVTRTIINSNVVVTQFKDPPKNKWKGAGKGDGWAPCKHRPPAGLRAGHPCSATAHRWGGFLCALFTGSPNNAIRAWHTADTHPRVEWMN